MKITSLSGLKAVLLFCAVFTFLSSQLSASVLVTEPSIGQSVSDLCAQSGYNSSVTCTSIELSDPAVYAGKQFHLYVSLKNTGKQKETHTVSLYRKDASAAGGKVLMSSKQLVLTAGQDTEVDFTLAAENLLVKGQPVPENFVFFVGDREVTVAYVK